ncbi:hypothetical protein [Pendulispora albinea]|uniref:Lipoprotein n=1 Tax=Pendulispora albinea TaxID=2741071 RepID=A0ABZ2M690_9BACT
MQSRRRSWMNSFIWGAAAVGVFSLVGCSTGETDLQAPSPQAVAEPTAKDVDEATKQIAPMLDRSNVTVSVVEGGGSAHFNGGFQNAMLARINADGTVSEACVDSAPQANAFFAANIGIKLRLPLNGQNGKD